MVKNILSLFILISLQLFILVQPIFAATPCKDQGIDWNPKTFLENATDWNLKFTINDPNTLNVLKNNSEPGSVYLLVDKSTFTVGLPTPAVAVQNNEFVYTLNGAQITKDKHTGTLRWIPKRKSVPEEFCSDVAYQVGSVGACTIDPSLPSKIPTNSEITIKFVGKTNTGYSLQDTGLSSTRYATATTDAGGQGEFTDVPIPGSNGDTIRLAVISMAAGTQACYKTFTIDSTATPPAPVSVGPVTPRSLPTAPTYVVPVAIPCTGRNCTIGGGIPCGDKDHPAIQTAIGCVHTNPAEFVTDFMKFAIGISGGLAFLMMLLGAFQMITSGGNPDSLNNGRTRLTSAIIGLLFVIFATLLMQIIGVDILFNGINGFGK